jgi:hypothetical protein
MSGEKYLALFLAFVIIEFAQSYTFLYGGDIGVEK